jgi:transposase-like protein
LPTDVFGSFSSFDDSADHLRRLPCKLKVRGVRSRPPIERRNEIAAIVKVKVEQLSGESVSSIAAELGVKTGCLRYWFPDDCTKLSEQHRTARKDRSRARQEAQCRRLEEIVRQIAHEGEYPSRRRVNGYLQKESMSLAQNHLNQALQKILR